MKRWILLPLLLSLLWAACGEDAPKAAPVEELSPQAIEAEVLHQVQALPEVKKLALRVHQLSSGRASLELLVLQTPSDSFDFYRVAAAENSSGRFRPVYQFDVYPQNDWEIRYYDAQSKEQYALAEWRASLKQAQE